MQVCKYAITGRVQTTTFLKGGASPPASANHPAAREEDKIESGNVAFKSQLQFADLQKRFDWNEYNIYKILGSAGCLWCKQHMLFLTVGAQRAVLSGVRWLLGDHMLCCHYFSSVSFCLLYLQLFPLTFLFPSASVCSASWIRLVALVCAKVRSVLKTWMIVLTSGQRTSICAANQKIIYIFKKEWQCRWCLSRV